jgi:hypothetical protein
VRQSESIDKIAPALLAVHRELKPLMKDSENPHFKSKFVSLDSLTEYVRPILASQGIAVMQGCGDLTNGGLVVETTLLHESGQWLASSVEMPVEKNTPQAAGSSLTYGRRYSLSAILAISADEDDDGNAASKPRQRSGAKAGEKSAPATPDAPITPDSPLTFGSKKGTKIKELPDSFLQWGLEDGRNFGVRTADWQAAFRKELASRDGVTV